MFTAFHNWAPNPAYYIKKKAILTPTSIWTTTRQKVSSGVPDQARHKQACAARKQRLICAFVFACDMTCFLMARLISFQCHALLKAIISVVEDFRQAGDLYILIVRSWREFELLSGRMRENQDKNAAAGDQVISFKYSAFASPTWLVWLQISKWVK